MLPLVPTFPNADDSIEGLASVFHRYPPGDQCSLFVLFGQALAVGFHHDDLLLNKVVEALSGR
jgi:hypothetical protein